MAEREMPAGLADERSLLDAWLDYNRATLLVKCEGLTGEQLIKRSCEPSAMSLIGLVRHMTEMERVYGHRLADWEIRRVAGPRRTKLGTRLAEQAQGVGLGGGLAPASGAELAEDIGDVHAGGFGRDKQLGGDLLVAAPGGD